jgi:hypothetical protein
MGAGEIPAHPGAVEEARRLILHCRGIGHEGGSC